MPRKNDSFLVTLTWPIDEDGMVELSDGTKIEARRFEKALKEIKNEGYFADLLAKELVNALANQEGS